MSMDGILFLNKPVGYTSRKVCNEISRIYSEKKVGHVGTLDPFASGLLIVAMGKCTKAVTFFDEAIKEYEADIVLGKESDTLDNTGNFINEIAVPELTKEQINKVLVSFLGDQKQIPPMTSAIHVNGKRLYEYAHEGKEVDRPTRDIHIYELKLLSFKDNVVTIYCKVSKGTYIRSLGSDIANKLGTVGYLNRLVRVGVNPFKLEEASSYEEVKEKAARMYSTSDILSRFMNAVSFDDKTVEDIKNGKITYLDIESKENRILVLDSKGNAIAVYTKENEKLKFARGLF